ncbi:hypothetical protein IE077_004347 [Cardiosporidium cionae]|uniref:Uncharacterized protein n=1 Tax=Cardiosporidium cionae TaxID=476202 RepID=A0ABQ7JBL6_9APIC|nr:hypothetical protein IE077_004347 [Cardiosporidium cionae]|eukprot:KAF8821371.1 hypothetical protein IE077_004347 [Cardiosporidium cionae]
MEVILHTPRVSRSESADDLLKAMGYGSMKRRIVNTYEAITEMHLSNIDSTVPMMDFKTYFPLGIVKDVSVKFDCEPSEIYDSDTGKWESLACLVDGRILQRRNGAKGIMYDSRVILEKDPLGEVTGPIQVFQASVK